MKTLLVIWLAVLVSGFTASVYAANTLDMVHVASMKSEQQQEASFAATGLIQGEAKSGLYVQPAEKLTLQYAPFDVDTQQMVGRVQ